MLKYVVAGAWALLSVLAGILGCLVAAGSCWKQENTTPDEKQQPESKCRDDACTAELLASLKVVPLRSRVLVALSAVLVCAAALRLSGEQVRLLTSGRLLVTALLLLSAMMIDLQTHRIPNKLVLTMLAAGTAFLVSDYLWMRESFRGQLLSSAVGLMGFLVLFYLMSRMTHGGIGMGDVKLIAAEGWMVGFVVTLWATMFSLVLCSLAAVFLILFRKRKTSDQIPFGPFLFWGYMLSLLICNL